MNRTPKQWLALGDKLGLELAMELAMVLTDGPWEHCCKDVANGVCNKCSKPYSQTGECPVPDPITIDWNAAMEWRDKIKDTPCSREEVILFMNDIARESVKDKIKTMQQLYSWWIWNATPKDWLVLIACCTEQIAAVAKGGADA